MSEPYAATTRGIRVGVTPMFLPDQSDPDENRYIWAYRVRIENTGNAPVKLMKRTWVITDARGREQRVHGPGVVGEQPTIVPGGAFEYTSGTPLETASGIMSGAYHMVAPDTGEAFDIAIPTFSLDSPHQGAVLN